MPCDLRFWKPHRIEMMVNDGKALGLVNTKRLQQRKFLSKENWQRGCAMFTNEG